MKIRLDYVTNSSSSSFLVSKSDLVQADIDSIFDHARNSWGFLMDGTLNDVKRALEDGFANKGQKYSVEDFIDDAKRIIGDEFDNYVGDENAEQTYRIYKMITSATIDNPYYIVNEEGGRGSLDIGS